MVQINDLIALRMCSFLFCSFLSTLNIKFLNRYWLEVLISMASGPNTKYIK